MFKLTAQLGSGDIRHLIDTTMAQIRKHPGQADLRVFLFQLYCLVGDWERALKLISSAVGLDNSIEDMARAYREIIRCEVYRNKVFLGEKSPLFLGEPETWLGKVCEALRLTGTGNITAASEMRGAAFDEAPTSAGNIDGQSFTWLADADMRLGPIIEAFINGKYYWIPVHKLRKITLEAPTDLRDLVWLPATLTFITDGEQLAFIPSRYPNTEKSADDDFLLARKTDWQDIGDDSFIGIGQRMFATDNGDFPLLDTRLIEFA